MTPDTRHCVARYQSERTSGPVMVMTPTRPHPVSNPQSGCQSGSWCPAISAFAATLVATAPFGVFDTVRADMLDPAQVR